jgi:hypothetical protein
MNLLLHNVGPTPAGSGGCPAPVGRKSSIKVIGEEGDVSGEAITYERDDFWATTSNKQLNFVQLIKSLLKINGRAAVIVPDNVLFEGRAGSAQAATRHLWVDLNEFVSLHKPFAGAATTSKTSSPATRSAELRSALEQREEILGDLELNAARPRCAAHPGS